MMSFSFGNGSTQTRIMKELFPGLWAVNWGPVCEALPALLLGDLAEGDTDLSVFCSGCCCLCLYWGSQGMCKYCHTSSTLSRNQQRKSLVDTGLILEFVCCCQNLSVKERGLRPVYWGAFTVISDGKWWAAVFHGYSSKLHGYKHQKYFLRGRRARYSIKYSWLSLTGRILWWV